MAKYLVFNFDDGTIYDKEFIELLNKYNVSATFNLNSNLDGFIWYYDNTYPIERFRLNECVNLYKNHEVASHTKTHPILTELTDEQIVDEVENDRVVLSKIFNQEVESFAVPFIYCNEREIEIIKNNTNIKYLRLSVCKDKYDFSLPEDKYHVKINALYNDKDLFNQIKEYSNSSIEDSLFIISGHSYEFMLNNDWSYVEDLIKYIKSFNNIEITTFNKAMKELFKGE